MVIKFLIFLFLLIITYDFYLKNIKETFQCNLDNPTADECNEYLLEKNESNISKLKTHLKNIKTKFNKIRDTELINREIIKKNKINISKLNDVSK
jgi:hypothetical protein